MTTAQLIALVAGATALVVALGHLVTDITGAMDKLRRTPIIPKTSTGAKNRQHGSGPPGSSSGSRC